MSVRNPARRKRVPGIDQLESRQLLSATPVHPHHATPGHHKAPVALVHHAAITLPPVSVSGLTISPSPTVNRSFLFGTTAIARNDIWAVGEAGDAATLAEHFDGTRWSVVHTPALPAGTVGALNAVTATASNNVYAVGETVANSIPQPLVEHFDGTSWSIVSSPRLPTGGGIKGGELRGVTAIAANNIWAVGNLGFGHGNLIEHFDGTSWSVVPVPQFTSNDVLFGVSGTSASDVWAVGKLGLQNSSPTPGAEVLHFDGHAWSQVATPSLPNNELRSVKALAPNNAWAVGSVGSATLIEHFDGTSWKVVPSPSTGVLNSVAAVSAHDIWAVGSFTDQSGFERTLTEHFDGTSWSVVASPNATSAHNELQGVTALADGTVVAVGFAGAVDSTNVNGLILKK